jgi:hypothetical protein
MIDRSVPKMAMNTLATPQMAGWTCHGFTPVAWRNRLVRMYDRAPNTRPITRYGPLRKKISPSITAPWYGTVRAAPGSVRAPMYTEA